MNLKLLFGLMSFSFFAMAGRNCVRWMLGAVKRQNVQNSAGRIPRYRHWPTRLEYSESLNVGSLTQPMVLSTRYVDYDSNLQVAELCLR